MRTMNWIFSLYLEKFVLVYLDDIVIFSMISEDHLPYVKIMINTLRENQFYLSAYKLL